MDKLTLHKQSHDWTLILKQEWMLKYTFESSTIGIQKKKDGKNRMTDELRIVNMRDPKRD